MKKLIWVILGGAFLWIAADFIMDTQDNAKETTLTAPPTSSSSTQDDEGHSLTDEEKEFEENMEENPDEEPTQDIEVTESAQFEDGSEDDFDVATKMTVGSDLGQTVHDFELEDMDGNTVKLSDYRGKKVFLNFWASWCPPCRAEMPHLQDFSETQDDTVVLGVNVTSSESNIDNVKQFLDEMEITFKNVYGTPKQADQFRTQSLPTSYFIGSDGVIYDKVVGPVTKDALQARFDMIN